MSKRSCPWHLQNVMCPWCLGMSCAPGTWISSHWSLPHEQSSHWCSSHEQSSHICRSASVAVSEITSLYRWHSPSHVEVFHHRKSAQAICHTGLLKYSTLGVPCWYMGRVLFHLQLVYTVCDGNTYSQSQSLHCTACLKSGGRVLGKCCTFLCCSQQMKLISVWLLMLGARQPPYASWWCYWVASWWNDGGWLLSTCQGPHIGCQNSLLWVLPLLCKGEAHALHP